jgi:DNA-binding LacI/PurR family transcriptional regulator
MVVDSASEKDVPAMVETLTLHRSIYQELVREVKQGVYRPGERMPSEAALCERFGASRITVAKAVQALQREGLVTRRAGSGTYVEPPRAAGNHQFGLLIPQLGSTEIFEPICQGIMRAPLAKSNVLLWGHVPAETEAEGLGALAEQLCRQFIDQKVSGVFFAPLEYTEDRETANRRIVEMLAKAKIPVVLLDRSVESFPKRSNLDLVGINNHRASYTVTSHLWQQGARRIAFVARERSASTIVERIAGYQFAMYEHQLQAGSRVLLGDVNDPAFVRRLLKDESPDGIVCGNDLTAAQLMRSLLDLGAQIPEKIRMASFDDVSYSQYLPVPLTTIHQDCSEIGRAALSLMLARLREPHRKPWDVRVPFELVVRQSCGSPAGSNAQERIPETVSRA